MRTYGYIRVDLDSNIEKSKYISSLKDFGFNLQKNRLVIEKVLAKKSICYRNSFLNLIEYALEQEDTLIVQSLDCLGSSFEEIHNTINKIDKKRIKLIYLEYSRNEITGELKIFFLHFLNMCKKFKIKLKLPTLKT